MSADGEFTFDVEDIDGVRLIRARFPARIRSSAVPEAYAKYLTLWDDERPTVVISDVSGLEAFTEEIQQVLNVVMKRITIHPGFIATAWVTGSNHGIVLDLTELMREAGRDPETIFLRDDQAIAYLRLCIEQFRT